MPQNREVRRYLGHNYPTEICYVCGTESLIVDGKLACCNLPSRLDTRPWELRKFHRPVWFPNWKKSKRRFSLALRKKLAARTCTYCRREFGSIVLRGYERIRLEMELDHIVPWSKSQNDHPSNLVPACNICNKLKKNHLFRGIPEIREFLRAEWRAKGYSSFRGPR